MSGVLKLKKIRKENRKADVAKQITNANELFRYFSNKIENLLASVGLKKNIRKSMSLMF